MPPVKHFNSGVGNGPVLTGGIFQDLPLGHIRDGFHPGVFVDEHFFKNPSTISSGNYRNHNVSAAGADVAAAINGQAKFSLSSTSTLIVETPEFCQIASTSADNSGATQNSKAGFETRFFVEDASDVKLAVGLTPDTPSSVFTAGVFQGGTEFLGFLCDDGSTIKGFRDDNEIATSTVTLADGTWLKLGVKIDRLYDGQGVNVILFVNGAELCRINKLTDTGFTSAPGQLSAFIHFYSTAGTDIDIDRSTYAADWYPLGYDG